MAKIIGEIALVAGAIVMGVFSFGLADLGYLGGIMGALTPAQVSAMAMAIGTMGGGMLMSSIAQALAGGGPATSTSTAAPNASRKTIYGQTRVAGTKIYQSTNSAHAASVYNQICAWASHQCEQVSYVYLDGREVYFLGALSGDIFDPTTTYNHQACAGAQGFCDTETHTDPGGTKYNFYASSGNYHVYCESTTGSPEGLLLGLGINPGVASPGGDGLVWYDPNWTTSCMLKGICATYVAASSNPDMFGNFPQVKALVKGKNTIYDPRGIPSTSAWNHTGAALAPFESDGVTPNLVCYQWTQNAALIIADFLTSSDYGLAVTWDEINIPQLIAAANLCDSQIPLATPVGAWLPNHVYTPGQVIIDSNNRQEQCLGYATSSGSGTQVYSGGTSGSSEPTWATGPGQTTFDHEIEWLSLNTTGTTITESMYTINGDFEWASTPGDTLAQMLEAIGGAQCLTLWNGQWNILPATWYGTSGVSYDINDMMGKVSFRRTKYREICNAVRAKYTCPDYPYAINGYDSAHKDANIFDGCYQPTDAPEYAQDALHGYAGDANLIADGGVKLYQDRSYNYVQSVATCQRLMKIYLLRKRSASDHGAVWTGTIQVNAKGLQNVPGDVIELTLPQYNWTNKLFEILEIRHIPKIEEGKPVVWVWEFDLTETDPSIYVWNTSEERSMTNANSPTLGNISTPSAVTGLTLECDASTSIISGGAVIPQILASWTLTDSTVTSTIIQYQVSGASTWLSAVIVTAGVTSTYISPVTAGSTYNVQVETVNSSGVSSAWVGASITVPSTLVGGQLFQVNGA